MTARRPSTSRAAQLRKQRIVASTRALLRDRVAAKVIVSDIAELADVAPSTIYNLLGTRDAVMRAVLEKAIDHVADATTPVDHDRPVQSVVALVTTAAEVLTEDSLAYRRAIAAMSDSDDGVWLETSMAELLEARLTAVGGAFDRSIPLARLADLILVGFRGVLISWSYGHIADCDLAIRGQEIALHVLGTTAHPDIAAEITTRLVELATTPSTPHPEEDQ